MLNDTPRTPACLALALLLLAMPSPTEAQQREHTVRRGETLWELAGTYLDNPFLWPRIYEANRSVVENPHWIYPAERLIIPPLLRRSGRQPLGEPLGGDRSGPLGAPADLAPRADAAEEGERPSVSVEVRPLREPEPADTLPTRIEAVDVRRPIVGAAEYLATPWLSRTAEREVAGRIIRLADPSAEMDRIPSALHPNDAVHLGRLRGERPQPGDSLLIVRFGRRVADRGRIVEPLGVLRVDTGSATVVTARLIRQFGDPKIGDVLLPLRGIPAIGLGEPDSIEAGIEGHLLQFFIPESLHSTTDLAFLSVGHADGVGIGDEFAVYVPARGIDNERAERLPPTRVGSVRVVRVAENSSTARVLGITHAALRDGLPIRMIRKMR